MQSKELSSYFELLGVPVSWQVDESLISSNFRKLQAQYHPDKVASGSDSERRRAVQYSSRLNDAIKTLKSPVLRAAYLLKLAGVDADMSSATFKDPAFLMQQMELREKLGGITSASDPEAALEEMFESAQAAFDDLSQEFEQRYTNKQFEDAKESYAKLQFIDKLSREAEELEHQVLDG